MGRLHTRYLIFSILFLVLAACIAPVSADDRTINPGNSIAVAIAAAAAGDTIILNPGTYPYNGTVVSKNLIIRANTSYGHDATDTIIDASMAGRIFTVNPGVTATIDSLTLRDGVATGAYGGAIYNNGGTMTVTSSTITNCTAGWGGAIYNNAGTLTVTLSTITECSATVDGGAISNAGGVVTVTSSTITDCSAGDDGGAIYNVLFGSTVTVTSSTITDCSAGDDGGAIYDDGVTMTVTSSTITECSAGGSGGAILTFSGTLMVTSSTITECSATLGGAIYTLGGTVTSSSITDCTASDDGGAIYNQVVTLTVTSSSITECSASDDGGAIFNVLFGSTVTVTSSTITGCTADGGGDAIYRSSGTVNAENNWWGTNADPSGFTYGTVGVDPWLVLGISADPAAIPEGGTSVIRASLTHNSDGTDTSGGGVFVPDGIVTTFAALSGGSVAPATAGTTNGVAETVFTLTEGTGSISATVDDQTVTVGVMKSVPAAPYTGSSTSDSLDTGRASSCMATCSGAGAGQPMIFAINELITADVPWAIISVTIESTEELGPTDVIVTDVNAAHSDMIGGRYTAGVVSIVPVAVNPSKIDHGHIVFAIDAGWLIEHGLAPEDIVMMHNTDGVWEELPTTYDYESGGVYYLTATTPDFSHFAIATRAETVPADTTVPVTTYTAPADETPGAIPEVSGPSSPTSRTAVSLSVTISTTAVPAASAGPKNTAEIPFFTIAAAVAGIVLVAGSGLLVRRWWIRRQNPALFEEHD